jgi:hypothetical protein
MPKSETNNNKEIIINNNNKLISEVPQNEIIKKETKSFEDIIKENINIENFDYDHDYIKKQLREFYLYWSEKSIN